MARQNIQPNSEERLFESFMDFSGGLNSEISNERLRPNEFPVMQNVELSSRASARKRSGRIEVTRQEGIAQGKFAFYREQQTQPDWIFAVGGYLYTMASPPVKIPIKDGANVDFTFQATLPIEAVQYQGSLFVATGTKLVEITYENNTWKAETVTPYTPSVMEAIYIGTNALADNPSAYVQDGESAELTVAGIKPNTRTGAINKAIPLVAYVSKPASITSVDYKWEYKRSIDTTYTMGQDWKTGADGKTYKLNVSSEGKYDIKVTVRNTAAQSTTATYVLSSYEIKQTDDVADLPYTGIQTCRKILLHWDRILLSGDNLHPYQIYISDVTNPRYYPVTNSVNFDAGKREAINAIVKFQSYLVVMTNTTIQTLLNKDPSTYERYLINDGVGCSAPKSAVVVGNQIIFKSFEGLQSLTPNPYRIDTMNVKRVDYQIKSEVPKDNDCCAIFYDNQYWLAFPTQKVIYRYYFEVGVWVKDVSESLNLIQFTKSGDKVYNLTKNGRIYLHDTSVYKDADNSYTMIVESKLHDLSASFNYKKLRQLYVIARHYITHSVELLTRVYADSVLVLNPEHGRVVITETNDTVWETKTEPNMMFYTGSVLGEWILGRSFLGDVHISVQKASILGKCRRVKVTFTHEQDYPCELYGFGLEFKLKKP